jgi:hypothetical protein
MNRSLAGLDLLALFPHSEVALRDLPFLNQMRLVFPRILLKAIGIVSPVCRVHHLLLDGDYLNSPAESGPHVNTSMSKDLLYPKNEHVKRRRVV